MVNYVDNDLNRQVPDLDWKSHILPEPRGRVRELTTNEELRRLSICGKICTY